MVDSFIGDDGDNILLHRGYSENPSTTSFLAPSVFKVGFSQADPVSSDSDLTNPVPISGTEQADACSDPSDWGVVTATNYVSVSTSVVQEGSTALCLVKADTGSVTATFFNEDNMNSLDFTDKRFFMRLFADTSADFNTTASVRIGFGSSTADYWFQEKDLVDLVDGWNAVNFTIASADGVVGSPVTASCDSGVVVARTTAAVSQLSTGELVMDDWFLASDGDFTKGFQSGFPKFDTTKKEVNVRGFLSVSEANGFDIDGSGLFNEDDSPMMHSVDKFSSVSKTGTEKVVFIWTDKIVKR